MHSPAAGSARFVWARRLDQPAAGPEFVGAATLAVARPDVAAAFGPEHHHAGYQLMARLAPGRLALMRLDLRASPS